MQGLQDVPRDGLSIAFVTDLLQTSPAVQVEYGAEWFNSSLALVQDISEFMLAGSTVSSDIYSTIHRSCSLNFSSDVPFSYASDFVRPYMVLVDPDTGIGARFNLGLYTLEQPEFGIGVLPSKMTFSGLDLLHLLDQPIGDSYEVAIGTDPVVEAAALIGSVVPGATIEYTISGTATAQTYTWPMADNLTYLAVVNDLLAMVGYLGVWVDWDGVFQLGPYVDPTTGTVEWTFDLTSSHNIVAEERAAQQTFFNVPNWWRFVMSNLSAAPVEGSTMLTYIDEDPANPGSFANRGRYVKKTMAVDAVDYPSLVAAAAVTIASDLSPSETFTVKTSPFPLAWHRDLIRFIDPNLANIPPANSSTRRVLARQWEITLDGGADMTWTWQTVLASDPG